MQRYQWLAVERVMRSIHRSLAMLGAMYGFVPSTEVIEELTGGLPDTAGRGATNRRAADWQLPPSAHPERLRPDLPLSEVELAIQQELVHLDRFSKRGDWW